MTRREQEPRHLNRRDVLAAAGSLGLAATLPSAGAHAQAAFPDRPIKLIVPFSPGGLVDVVARLWTEEMRSLGTFVIENQGGAGGITGAVAVARAQPDGYTMLLGNTSTQVVNPLIMASPPYDPVKTFQAVAIIANSAVSFAVHPSVPAKNLTGLIAYIKANPEKASYGSPGTGTMTHLGGEIFKQLAGLPKLVHVPYRGAGPGLADLVAGHIPMMALNITSQGLELHRAGQIRIVTVLTPKRINVLPDVQAAAEIMPDLIAQLFTGLFVPAATPKELIEKVATANRQAMGNAAFRKKLVDAGFEPVLDTPLEAQKFVNTEIARLGPQIKVTNFKPG
jgi:tripartite-type tricarboxylate transporter receptor subunit TctC